MFEEIACASEALKVADVDLNKHYQNLLRQVDPNQKKVLIQSQRAWLASVRAHVKFIYSLEGHGSSGRLVTTNYSEEQTKMRAKELANWRVEK